MYLFKKKKIEQEYIIPSYMNLKKIIMSIYLELFGSDDSLLNHFRPLHWCHWCHWQHSCTDPYHPKEDSCE